MLVDLVIFRDAPLHTRRPGRKGRGLHREHGEASPKVRAHLDRRSIFRRWAAFDGIARYRRGCSSR
ncbi:unnamed protein product [Ectocarpus sp. 6 AP-2014]